MVAVCAILDANAASAVFGRDKGGAAKKFLEWISFGPGSLVVGGELRQELEKIAACGKWLQQNHNAGRARFENDSLVDERASELEQHEACLSDDPHVIALAQISGARLLYTNDSNLQKDFTNRRLIKNPRGKVYTTMLSQDYNSTHRRLLTRNVCRGPA